MNCWKQSSTIHEIFGLFIGYVLIHYTLVSMLLIILQEYHLGSGEVLTLQEQDVLFMNIGEIVALRILS